MSIDQDNDQQAIKHLFVMMIEITRFYFSPLALASLTCIQTFAREYIAMIT